MKKIILACVAFSFVAVAQADQLKLDKMQQQIELLSNEVLKLKNQRPTVIKSQVNQVQKDETYYKSTGASKVYGIDQGLSIGGYGELVYQDKQSGLAKTDAYRFVPYIGYKFSDTLLLNAEIEIEHGNEIYLEFAYLDFMPMEEVNFRVGHLLVPMGLVNLYHEPVFFNSVYRPEVESNLIPSTWHENGIEMRGLLFDRVSYSVGVVNSLDLSNDTRSTEADSWIRKGRQKAIKAKAEDISYFARLDYKFVDGNEIGVSYYAGDSRHDNKLMKSAHIDIFDIHFNYKISYFRAMGVYSSGNLSDTWTIQGDLGKKVEGYYIDLAYDLGSQFGINPITAFVRHSEYDLHKEVVDSVVKDETLNKTITTFGINYKPHHQVILKADYQIRKNAKENEANYFNLGIGFVF